MTLDRACYILDTFHRQDPVALKDLLTGLCLSAQSGGESVQMPVMMVIMSRPEMNGGRRFVPDDQSAQAQDNCSYY